MSDYYMNIEARVLSMSTDGSLCIELSCGKWRHELLLSSDIEITNDRLSVLSTSFVAEIDNPPNSRGGKATRRLVSELIRRGLNIISGKGSHKKVVHPDGRFVTIIPFTDDFRPGTWRSILRDLQQAGIDLGDMSF